MSDVFTIKQFKFVKDFKCIAGECEDSCCIGWDVGVDIETFSFLESQKNHPLTELIEEKMYENEHCFDDRINFGNIALNQKKECSFLDENKLCRLQIAFGEKGISNVCNSFPRVINYIDGVMEKSLSIACPEAARMLLMKNDYPEFETLEGQIPHLLVLHSAETTHPGNEGTNVKYLKELREFSMWAMMQNGTISQKLVVVGKFLDEVERHSPDDIPTIIEKFKSEFETYFDAIEIGSEHYQAGLDLLALMDIENEVDSPRFVRYFKLCKDGLGAKKRKNKYERLLQGKVGEFLREHHFILENYIINDMFHTIFPFTEEESFSLSYKMLVAKIALLELMLCGVVNSGEELTKELVVDLAQVFTKTVEHHYSYLLRIQNSIKKQSIDFAWLIK